MTYLSLFERGGIGAPACGAQVVSAEMGALGAIQCGFGIESTL